MQKQTTYALLLEGVSSAKMEAHKIQSQLNRVLNLIDASKEKDAVYEVAGDVIVSVPDRMTQLQRHLDRTLYALSIMVKEDLRDGLSMVDRKQVDGAIDDVISRVASRYLQADLDPPLGYPGGACRVIDRIKREVSDKRLQEELIEDIEKGFKLDNAEAAKIYDIEQERGVGRFKQIILSAHAQYRMDQREINVPLVRRALTAFIKDWGDEKSRRSPLWQRWEQVMSYGEALEYLDKHTGVFIIFKVQRDVVVLITTYYKNESDPSPMPEESCQLLR